MRLNGQLLLLLLVSQRPETCPPEHSGTGGSSCRLASHESSSRLRSHQPGGYRRRY